MPATVTGIYRNGQIILDEELPVNDHDVKVIVTLAEETVKQPEKPKRQFGLLKGTFTHPYWSSQEFNEPLDDSKDYT